MPPDWLTMRYGLKQIVVAAFLLMSALAFPFDGNAQLPEPLTVQVITIHPHDTEAFTQGLVFRNGVLFESAGRYGRSNLRKVSIADGTVLQQRDLSEAYFAEGLAVVGESLFQLTWKEGVTFVYDAATFEETDRFQYSGEGWGLCFDGKELVMSDGSDRLTFRDPKTFGALRTVSVRQNGAPRNMLNELECVGEWVFANLWQTDTIIQIEKQSGNIVATIDASGLLSESEAAGADVLNGIAHRADTDTFYITGKLWPKLFEVRFVSLDPDTGVVADGEDGGSRRPADGGHVAPPFSTSGSCGCAAPGRRPTLNAMVLAGILWRSISDDDPLSSK